MNSPTISAWLFLVPRQHDQCVFEVNRVVQQGLEGGMTMSEGNSQR